MEVRELLAEFKFDSENTPIVIGSALNALEDTNPELGRDAVVKLLDHVDEYIPTPERDLEKPYCMPIEQIFSIAGRLKYHIIPNRGAYTNRSTPLVL